MEVLEKNNLLQTQETIQPTILTTEISQ